MTNPRRLWPVFTGCLLILLLVTGCGLGAPRLAGTLRDAETGNPIIAAQITVGEQVATTDDQGAFALELELGDYEAIVQAPGYVSRTEAFSLTSAEKNHTVTLDLEPRTLTGTVRAGDTGEPLADLSVAYGEAVYSTGAEGTFSVAARETHDLTISGYGVVEQVLPAAEVGALFSSDGSLLAPLEVAVQPRAVQGAVLEPDGTPVEGAEVSIGLAYTRTNAQGRYALRFVETGEPVTVNSAAHRPPPDTLYQGEDEFTITVEPFVARLAVAEEETGRALAGATVLVAGEPVGLTDANGEASARVSPETSLAVATYGYLTATVTYQGESDPIAVALTPTLLQGTVVEKDTGAPVQNALVQIFRGESTDPELMRTDTEGRYAIPDATDVNRLFIKAAGYDRLDVPVTRLGQLDLALNPFAAQGIYIPFGLLSLPDRIYELLDLVVSSPSLNAVVIDVKGDWAHIAWPSDMPVAQEIGAYVPGPMDMDEVIAAAKERGIYTIARIVTFKDRVLAEGKPEWAIHTQSGALYLDGENLPWSDPFLTEVWDYNIGIALEAVEKGFDEVQYDYLRFPSEGRVSDRVYSQEATFESRTAAMAGFCAAAYAAIEPTPAFLSADIFGLTVWVDPSRDMGIGQRLDDIAAHMDYISPMLYPQTFNPANLQFLGISDVELYPYETLYYSVQKTLSRTATRVRPWLQHYSGRYTYGLDELLRQRKGAEDGGATGWLYWNAKGSYIEELFGEDPYSLMAVIPQPPEDEEDE